MLDVNLTTTEISDAESTAEFIFNYRSEFCSSDYPRVASQTFYDAKFRAAHFWTDFALLEIDPSNTLPPYLVYAGWDRADDATATLRNISHPSNQPQQIITGYKVTSFDPWKYNVNWSSAGGSSGSALINYNYKVVGNLSYGNTLFGKFSSAWDNGSSEKSLKNWLSPSSNLTSVQTLNPLTITGGNVHVCYGSNTTLNMPFLFSHESASWSVSSNLSIVSSGSNIITVTPSSPSFSGLGTVTATISGYSYSANVWVGKPGTVSNMTVMMGPSDNQICRNSGVTIAIGNTNHDLQGITQYNWDFGSWSSYFTGYESGGYVLSQRANISTNSSTPSSQNIAVKAQNSCGESTLSYNKTFYVMNCGSFKVAYPNPVKDFLQIGFNDDFVKLPETMALFSEVTQKEVYRIDYSAIEKALEYDRNLNIDVSKMDRGVYFLHIALGKNATEVIRILIE